MPFHLTVDRQARSVQQDRQIGRFPGLDDEDPFTGRVRESGRVQDAVPRIGLEDVPGLRLAVVKVEVAPGERSIGREADRQTLSGIGKLDRVTVDASHPSGERSLVAGRPRRPMIRLPPR